MRMSGEAAQLPFCRQIRQASSFLKLAASEHLPILPGILRRHIHQRIAVFLAAFSCLAQYNIYISMDHIELRSDTMTVLTPEMRASILTSNYGDWTYGEDETVKQLEAYAAEIFGKGGAAYVPSGVFGNQCSILTAGRPGEEILIRDKGHIIQHENGSVGRLARMMTRTIDCPEGYITPEVLKKHLRKKKDSQSPRTSILVLEFPTFEGLIPPLEQFHECARMAKAEGMHVHVDGARIFSGIAELKVDPSEVLKECSSVSLCLSKGLCAPVGSVVVGDSEFIARVKVNRKMMGGVMRKPGVVAGAGLIALKKMRFELWKDNEIARTLSQGLVALGWFEIVIRVETNIIFFRITDEAVDVAALVAFLKKHGVVVGMKSGAVNRFVIHHYIREEQVQTVLGLLKRFKEESAPVQQKKE